MNIIDNIATIEINKIMSVNISDTLMSKNTKKYVSHSGLLTTDSNLTFSQRRSFILFYFIFLFYFPLNYCSYDFFSFLLFCFPTPFPHLITPYDGNFLILRRPSHNSAQSGNPAAIHQINFAFLNHSVPDQSMNNLHPIARGYFFL